MDLSGRVKDLIIAFTEMRNAAGVNKKALNKTIARLEEAELWAKQISVGQVNGVPPNRSAVTGSTSDACTCTIIDGKIAAFSATCPIHSKDRV